MCVHFSVPRIPTVNIYQHEHYKTTSAGFPSDQILMKRILYAFSTFLITSSLTAMRLLMLAQIDFKFSLFHVLGTDDFSTQHCILDATNIRRT